ncbi:GH39 family glycosyl hydrolase [Swaminathania salitolerans]|uniref:Beta-xylosidase n=1 Tax=Swaminathania salitolerans TaxID=182838 RepID=A0A511BXD1_9PROT|nr:glycosyl hydrolase family 39 [Swaminathania salitolerans]GBQ11918.1 xylan 1,4-beta-xylosidase [Swaminathania salitolerans LMG 21291]GEL02668.1 beta-xylosidase [Swaminathania salitolerans]
MRFSRHLVTLTVLSLFGALPQGRTTALAAVAPPGRTDGQLPGPTCDKEIEIDTRAAGSPFVHSWEKSFGSDRADMVLTEGYLRNADRARAATGFGYVRFHGIFDDSMGIVIPDGTGGVRYNFRKIDAVYDSLLRHHLRPYVELSFMPSLLGSNPLRRNGGLEPLTKTGENEPARPVTDFSKGTLWYRANVTPPARMAEWNALIHAFVTHLETRYGREEIRRWPFEVWNEPDQATWTGTPRMASYFALYDNTARTIKSVDPALKVGGPATGAIHWVREFTDHVARAHVPADFVSTHIYANDPPALLRLPSSPRNTGNTVCDATRHAREIVDRSARPGLPLYISEFGADWDIHNGSADRPWIAPWLAETIRDCDGLAPLMSYWTFSDDFEEQGIMENELPGAYGLLSTHGIPKPAFNAFALLHRLGTQRLKTPSNADILATRRRSGTLALALWNRDNAREKTVALRLEGVSDTTQARIVILDRDHGTATARFDAMGRPDTPTEAQARALRSAARLPSPRTAPECRAADRCVVTLPPESLALLEIPAQGSRRNVSSPDATDHSRADHS